MAIHAYGAGRALILPWETIDAVAARIKDRIFQTGETPRDDLEICGERDDSLFTYKVTGLKEQDRSIWNELFQRYDPQNRYDPDSLFGDPNGHADLPSSISLQLINLVLPDIYDQLPEGYDDFTTDMAVALSYAVVLFEHVPEQQSHWLL